MSRPTPTSGPAGPGEPAASGEVTGLLDAVRQGEPGAMDRLVERLYGELRVAAHRQLRGRRPGQTLDTTALVHETYLKLAERSRAEWHDRTHFLAAAAVAMRHLLVDAARRRTARKRGGAASASPLAESRMGAEGPYAAESRAAEILAVHQALDALDAADPRLARMVELRFFGGLEIEEIAEILAVSGRTVKRDWRKARAFLYRAVHEGAKP
jgi:RNA polymerase sigma factor (TIGR02999 family)